MRKETMKVPCYECGAAMEVKPIRPDPHEVPEMMLVCEGCGRSEPVPSNLEGVGKDDPRLPGF